MNNVTAFFVNRTATAHPLDQLTEAGAVMYELVNVTVNMASLVGPVTNVKLAIMIIPTVSRACAISGVQCAT